MNRLEYNERIYNYKHGLVNSAENQTKEVVEHKETNGEEIGASQNEEHIEHADGWEWQEHEYIDKIPLGNGKYRYVYPDGSMVVGGPSTVNVAKAQYAREQATNKGMAATQTQMGQQNVKEKYGATPTGLYNTQPQAINKNVLGTAKINNNYGGTPGTMYANQPKQMDPTVLANAQLAGKGTPGGVTGQPLNNPLANQGKGPLETMGTPGSYTGNRDTAKWAGKGTPGGTNGPSLTKGQHAAETWNNFKNFVKEGSPLNKANEFYKEAPNYNNYDLLAIEQGNPYMREHTRSSMGLAHGLLIDYLRSTHPEAFDENGYQLSGDDISNNLYQNDPNFRELANRIFVAQMNTPTETPDYYQVVTKAAREGYTEPQIPQIEEPKATIQDAANFITNDGQIQPAEETKTSEEAPKNTIADFAMQIGANGPQNDLYDVYTKNSDPERRDYANYAMGYALGYLYGSVENVERAFPDWVAANGHLDLNDQNTFNDFCAYAYNYDPELKEIADAIYAGIYKTKQID